MGTSRAVTIVVKAHFPNGINNPVGHENALPDDIKKQVMRELEQAVHAGLSHHFGELLSVDTCAVKLEPTARAEETVELNGSGPIGPGRHRR